MDELNFRFSFVIYLKWTKKKKPREIPVRPPHIHTHTLYDNVAQWQFICSKNKNANYVNLTRDWFRSDMTWEMIFLSPLSLDDDDGIARAHACVLSKFEWRKKKKSFMQDLAQSKWKHINGFISSAVQPFSRSVYHFSIFFFVFF